MVRFGTKRRKAATDTTAKAASTPEARRRRTFHRAIKLLTAKSRSIAELRELLMQGRNATTDDVEEVLARLKEYGYLDDERFALSYASSRVRQRPVGRARLKRDLALKKVDKEIADEALDLVFAENSESDLIDLAIEKRTRLRGRPKNRDEAKRLFDHLLRQGFAFELVAEKVRAASQAQLDEDEIA
jgi:regulatory protein